MLSSQSVTSSPKRFDKEISAMTVSKIRSSRTRTRFAKLKRPSTWDSITLMRLRRAAVATSSTGVGHARPLRGRPRPGADSAPAVERLMASKTKATQPEDKEEAPEKEPPETPDAPLLLFDLSDAAVRKMIKAAKKRGYVTHEQINSVLPSEEVTSEQIEDILAMLNEVGINTVESEEAEPEEEAEGREEPEEEESEGGELAEVQRTAPAKVEKAEPSERTDDPVRMYLREMGSVGLLSREGEIAVAKRIEAGREAMIAGLCERPLTFQAVIIWRDELKDAKVLLRDIIDLEATYEGPEAKAAPPPMP